MSALIIVSELNARPFVTALTGKSIICTTHRRVIDAFNAWQVATHRPALTASNVAECFKFCATPLRGSPPANTEIVQSFLSHVRDTYTFIVAAVAESLFIRALTNVGAVCPILAVQEEPIIGSSTAVKSGLDLISAVGFTELMSSPTPAVAIEAVSRACASTAASGGGCSDMRKPFS